MSREKKIKKTDIKEAIGKLRGIVENLEDQVDGKDISKEESKVIQETLNSIQQRLFNIEIRLSTLEVENNLPRPNKFPQYPSNHPDWEIID